MTNNQLKKAYSFCFLLKNEAIMEEINNNVVYSFFYNTLCGVLLILISKSKLMLASFENICNFIDRKIRKRSFLIIASSFISTTNGSADTALSRADWAIGRA